ncbi:MAG: 50S ribosomal protein L15e [Candidatus Diapherotrites archaeon]
MGLSKAVTETFQKEYKGKKSPDYEYKNIYRDRLIEFRKEPLSIVKVDKPTNIARARKLGYKAKQGIVVARIRIRKGSGLHRRPTRGRRPKRMGVNKLTRRTSIKAIAERRVSKKFPNCEVLNSYFVGMDGLNYYYEVILVDTASPSIKSDRDLGWMTDRKHKGRAERGKTSAGKKARGQHKKGIGSEKARPSVRAKGRKIK